MEGAEEQLVGKDKSTTTAKNRFRLKFGPCLADSNSQLQQQEEEGEGDYNKHFFDSESPYHVEFNRCDCGFISAPRLPSRIKLAPLAFRSSLQVAAAAVVNRYVPSGHWGVLPDSMVELVNAMANPHPHPNWEGIYKARMLTKRLVAMADNEPVMHSESEAELETFFLRDAEAIINYVEAHPEAVYKPDDAEAQKQDNEDEEGSEAKKRKTELSALAEDQKPISVGAFDACMHDAFHPALRGRYDTSPLHERLFGYFESANISAIYAKKKARQQQEAGQEKEEKEEEEEEEEEYEEAAAAVVADIVLAMEQAKLRRLTWVQVYADCAYDYDFESSEYPIFWVGLTPEGHLVGVETKVVWT